MRTDWGLVAILFTVGLMAAMQFIKVSLTLDELSAYYARPVEVVSFLVSMVSLMGLVLGVVAGAVVARLGTRPVILGALALGAGVSLVGALLPPFWLMLPLRALEGLAHLALVVAVPTVMAGIATDRDRPLVMSIWAMFFGVAFAIGGLMFPWLIGRGGVPVIFALHAVVLAALGIVLLFRLPKSQTGKTPIRFFAAHRDGYSAPTLAGPGMIFVFYALPFIAAVAFIPDALGRPFLGVILPLISLGGTLAAGILCRSLPPRHVMTLGFGFVLVGGIGLSFGIVPAVYAMFIGMGLVPGACFAAIPAWNETQQDRARSTGVIAQMGNLGTATGTPLFAFALGQTGAMGMWVLLILLPLGGLAMVAWITRRIGL